MMDKYKLLSCGVLLKHSVSEEDDARQELKYSSSGKVITNCTICNKKLLLTKHPIAPNAFFIDAI